MKVRLVFLLFVIATMLSCQEEFDQRLAREAKEMTNHHCPQRMDDYTTLDSVVYSIPERTYIRYFTVSPEIPEKIFASKDFLHRSLLKELKNDVSWNACKEEGISFSYIYRESKSGKIVYSTIVTKEEYRR